MNQMQQPGQTGQSIGMQRPGQAQQGGMQGSTGMQQQAGMQQAGTQQGGMQPGAQGQMFYTQNPMPENVRRSTVGALNQLLADTTVLETQAKFAHWNVKGLEFVGLHELFDEIAEDFEDHADEIAERATALGGQAMGTVRRAAGTTRIPPMPAAVTGPEYVELLADRLAIHDANLYDAIQMASGSGDLDTADLLNEVSREVSKNLWFLEAHLQTRPTTQQAQGMQGMGGPQPQQTQLQQFGQGPQGFGQ